MWSELMQLWFNRHNSKIIKDSDWLLHEWSFVNHIDMHSIIVDERQNDNFSVPPFKGDLDILYKVKSFSSSENKLQRYSEGRKQNCYLVSTQNYKKYSQTYWDRYVETF